MHLNLKDLNSKPGNAVRVVSQIEPKTRLPFILGEPTTSKPKLTEQETKSLCGCFVSIYNPRNANLTEPQKLIRLDHDHISMKAVQRLY